MRLTKNKKWGALIIILFFVWGGISYQWYVCGIKDFCQQTTLNNEIK